MEKNLIKCYHNLYTKEYQMLYVRGEIQ